MSTTLEAPVGADTPNPRTASSATPVVWKVLRPLASLQLTVVLFALSMVLVFFGTLAQVDKGIWTVVDGYFRSWVVWVPFQLIAMFGWKFFEAPGPDAVWSGSFPLPGGWLIGGVMLVNLFAAHLVRFKFTWKRAGIITIHLGVILLMAGELVTGLYAVESRMVLQVGETSNFIDHSRRAELAFHDAATGRTVTVPQGLLFKGNTVTDPNLPVDVEVLDYFKNTNAVPADPGSSDAGGLVSTSGGRYKVVPATEEAGTKTEQREDMAGVRVRLLKKGTGEVLAERLFSQWEYRNANSRFFMALPTTVAADGMTYSVILRNERVIQPYSIELNKFEHNKHIGTTMAKDFASSVTLVDPESNEDRQVRIWMNHPLRHRGYTFYQAGTIGGDPGKPDTGTVLQVVKNPGWLLPYLSCAVVTLGMLAHFGMNLAKFTSRRAA